jgi:hypothetical protein
MQPPWLELGEKNKIIRSHYGFFWSRECWHPHRRPILISIFMISFVFIVVFTMFNFFVGAVTGGMATAIELFNAADEESRAIKISAIAERDGPK